MYVLMPEHPRARRGYVKRADLVLEVKLGRPLARDELAHHIDHNGLNDSPENLSPMTRADHARMHLKEAWAKRWGAGLRRCLVINVVDEHIIGVAELVGVMV